MNHLAQGRKKETLMKISKIVNSITIPMGYGELEAYLKNNKCPYYNNILRERDRIFEIKNYIKSGNNSKTPNYVLKKKPTYYMEFSFVYESKKCDEISNHNTLIPKREVSENIQKMEHENRNNNESQSSIITKNENALFRIEYNKKNQSFHYDNGTYGENTNGWETVCRNVEYTGSWTTFDMIRDVFGVKFDSTKEILNKYNEIQSILGISHESNIERHLTTKICVDFLKKNGFEGKIEKIEKTTFNL